MPRPTALDAARTFRSALANDEAQAAGRMATIYNRIYTGLQGDLAKLSIDIAAMDNPSRGAIMKLARMQAIQQQVKEQVTKFGGTVQNEVTIVQSQAVQAGIDNALKLIETSLPPLPDDVRKQLTASFARLPADAVEAAAGLTGQDSPLSARLSDLYGEYVAEQVGNHITAGIAKGDNPRTIARQLEKNVLSGLGSGLTSALTTVRTAQIKSYQLANHATYLANDNIVKGWVWHAELGSACLGCTSMHGTIHPLDETLDGHHNCRCAPIPQTITYEELGLDIPETVEPTPTGEEWFNEQSAATQRELMGPAKYEAWKDGKFEFGQLSQKYTDPVYGDMTREASLKELTDGGGGAAPQAPGPPPDEPTPPSGPQGTPVSEALDISKFKAETLGEVQHQLAAIDKVHTVEGLPTIPIKPSKRAGTYWIDADNTPNRIDSGKWTTGNPGNDMTLIHEVGHFIDHQALGSGGQFGTLTGLNPDIDNLLKVIADSPTFKILQDIDKSGLIKDGNGDDRAADRKYLNYLMSKKEVFARSYAQYIVTKTQDPSLLISLNATMGDTYPGQWEAEEFKPIEKAFDTLFGNMGWLK